MVKYCVVFEVRTEFLNIVILSNCIIRQHNFISNVLESKMKVACLCVFVKNVEVLVNKILPELIFFCGQEVDNTFPHFRVMVNPVRGHLFVAFSFSVHVCTQSKAIMLQSPSDLSVANRLHDLFSVAYLVHSSPPHSYFISLGRILHLNIILSCIPGLTCGLLKFEVIMSV